MLIKVPVTWSVYSEVTVEADSIEEACTKALTTRECPADAEYVSDSYEINGDPEDVVDDFKREHPGELYRLINYFDVWSGAENADAEDWQVNNLRTEKEHIVIDPLITKNEAFALLQRIGFLAADLKPEQLEWSVWDEGMMEFEAAEDGRPLGRFEREV